MHAYRTAAHTPKCQAYTRAIQHAAVRFIPHKEHISVISYI